MQLSTILTGLLATLTTAQYTSREGPFNLIIESSTNKTLNGHRLTACHSGAAIESLCTYPADANSISDSFYFNSTSGQTSSPKVGIITWNLTYTGSGGVVGVESEPLTWAYNPASNVALPVFSPGEGDYVQATFDKNGYLGVSAYVDDTVSPPKATSEFVLHRWYICQTYYGSYTYTTLAWTLGNGKPQNPSCQAVKIKKQAIPK